MGIDYGDIKREKILNNQREKILRREEKFFDKKENEFIEKKIAPIREKLEEKIPRKMIEMFEKAFEKGFYYVFENGTVIIEKSYNSEKLKNEADINEYILSKKVNNRNLSRIDKKVKQSILINKSITTIEGTVLGAFGVGLPDIPVFIGILLKTIYEICLRYGFDYDLEDEKVFILNIISAGTNKNSERILYSNEADRIGYNIDNNISTKININDSIKKTSKNLSESIIVSKVIQGIPIVGIYGAISNYKIIGEISELASIKYKKRLLNKL